MSKYNKHIFICENVRDAGNAKGSCTLHGGKEIREKIKSKIVELGLHKSIRVNSAGCLGFCKHGPVAVVYPDANWYGNIKLSDVDEIIESDLLNDKVVRRLELKDGE